MLLQKDQCILNNNSMNWFFCFLYHNAVIQGQRKWNYNTMAVEFLPQVSYWQTGFQYYGWHLHVA